MEDETIMENFSKKIEKKLANYLIKWENPFHSLFPESNLLCSSRFLDTISNIYWYYEIRLFSLLFYLISPFLLLFFSVFFFLQIEIKFCRIFFHKAFNSIIIIKFNSIQFLWIIFQFIVEKCCLILNLLIGNYCVFM